MKYSNQLSQLQKLVREEGLNPALYGDASALPVRNDSLFILRYERWQFGRFHQRWASFDGAVVGGASCGVFSSDLHGHSSTASPQSNVHFL